MLKRSVCTGLISLDRDASDGDAIAFAVFVAFDVGVVALAGVGVDALTIGVVSVVAADAAKLSGWMCN